MKRIIVNCQALTGLLFLSTCCCFGQGKPQTPRPTSGASASATKIALRAQYQERFALFEKKINEATTAGNLTADEAMSYKTQVYLLKRLARDAEKDSFDANDVARLNRKITKFQQKLPAIEAKKTRPSVESTPSEPK